MLGLQAGGALGVQAHLQPEVVSTGMAVAPIYLNPLRNVSDLVPERIDQGVDFSGSGPVYALGDGVVTNASAYYPGWGGGWITYQLSDGPDAGLVVYLAEDVTPTFLVGQHVTPSTVIGDMFEGGDGIETGWAQASGLSAESQLPEAGGIGGAARSRPWSASTSTNCSYRWAYQSPRTATRPPPAFSRRTTPRRSADPSPRSGKVSRVT